MATNSPKRTPRVQPKKYSTCLLYNTKEAREKLRGLTLASCNPQVEMVKSSHVEPDNIEAGDQNDAATLAVPDLTQLTVSDKMSCNFCDATFSHRIEQKRHYRSDWHRYNLKQRLKGKVHVTEDQFEDISGNISSLSGSDSDSDSGGDEGRGETRARQVSGLASQLKATPTSVYSSTDSESDPGSQVEDKARRLPKVYLRNAEGELLSVYRCVICHKKEQPARPEALVPMVTDVLGKMNWAVFMVGGGHFAAAIFNKGELVAHKTFHRYVVRAKRGTAQSSRDNQGGNAPKSAGASLRRYNEAALTQDIQDLISTWREHVGACDTIFLRAPSFNRKIFFGGKTPALNKEDPRIRLIPFQTRRPTFNEVRRVFETLASVECYGDESDLQDVIPLSPRQVFDPESGQLTVRDESQLTPKQRKILNKKLRHSPLVTEEKPTSSDQDTGAEVPEVEKVTAVPDHVLESGQLSSAGSTGSDVELLENLETMDLLQHKEYYATKKPKRRKKTAKQRRQTEPEANVMDEEKYHLKNNLYTACKVGDKELLRNLLAIFTGYRPAGGPTASSKPVDGEIVKPAEGPDKVSPDQDNAAQEGLADIPRNRSVEIEAGGAAGFVEEDVTESVTVSSDKESSSVTDGQTECSDFGVSRTKCDADKTEDPKHLKKTDDSPLSESKPSDKNSKPNVSDDPTFNKNVESKVGNNYSSCNENSKPNDSARDREQSAPTEVSKSCDRETDKEQLVQSSSNGAVVADTNIITETDSSHQPETTGASIKASVSPPRLQLGLTPTVAENQGQGQGQGQQGRPGVTDMSPVVTLAMLNDSFGDNGTSLLHVASREGHRGVVGLLLDAGANPTLREKTGHTPYMVSKDKATRNEFRKFMGMWPDKYDYAKAQIPAPLSEEMEAEKRKKEAEKKKVARKARTERQKVNREEEEKRQAEEREKQRFLKMSDREKRALAAERRLVTQIESTGAEKPVLARCFQCGSDMTGKTPFEYSDYKFCASKCLQQHRKSVAAAKS